MIFAYIGAAIAALLLVGLASLAVLWMAKTVGNSIRSRTVDLISGYDDLLDARSHELQELEASHQQDMLKAAAAEKTVTAAPKQTVVSGNGGNSTMSVVSRISTSAYRDAATGSLYQKIRSAFTFSPSEAIQKLPEEAKNEGNHPAADLLEALSADTVCAMASLPQEKQYELLHTTLEGAQRELVESYAQTHSSFDTISFYDFLRQTAATESKAPVLRVAPGGMQLTEVDGVRVIPDDSLCEGFELEAGNRVYDYSIKVREIC